MYTYDSDGNMIDDYGNTIHDPWVHEGLKEEEYYAMQAVDRAYTEELQEETDEAYKKCLVSNITKDKKYDLVSKIGFNNFKPFGEKVQSFSKKPLTLIYGPNSIGKSSFIHMSAYMRYIFETKSFDFANTDMFGDNINLGGFDKFIHKRDKNNALKIEFQFDDCSEAIIEYLKPNKVDFKHINELEKFTKEDIIDIINNSDKYIFNNFARLKKVRDSKQFKIQKNERESNRPCNKIFKEEFDFFASEYDGYHSRNINNYLSENDSSADKEQDLDYDGFQLYTSIIEHDGLRYEDYDGTVFYNPKNELKKYYDKYPYIYAEYFKGANGTSSSANYLEYSNIKKEFINDELKKIFISNILIPKFINFEKYMLLQEFNKSDFNLDSIELNPKEIEYIAERTLKRIQTIYGIYEYNNQLKKSNIPLKIIMELKYSTILKKVHLKKVEYLIQDTLYDAIEEVMLNNTDGYDVFTGGASYDGNSDEYMEYVKTKFTFKNNYEYGNPPILKNAPKIYQRHLFNEYGMGTRNYNPLERKTSVENARQEEKYSAIFLSYKKGYNKLIGAFNDMISFNKMQYIGPLRFYPERDETIKELDSNEKVIPDSKTSWSLLKKDEELRDTINEWLKDPKKLKTPYEIKYRTLYDVESSLHNLDFTKFTYANSIVMGKIEEIKKLGITPDISNDEEDKLVVDLSKAKAELEDSEDWEKFISDQRWHINSLIKFSALNSQEQFKSVFIEEGVFNQFETKEEMVFEDLRNNTQISNRDLGLGISQVLPILISTNTHKNTTIAVEQPELHLHPAVQCEIADEFIRSYKEKENNNEFLIETHSEHLLLRIMKRMRHTEEDREGRDKTLDLTPDDVCLLYIDSHKGNTFIRELKLDKDGSLLSRWPSGFFEESYNEMFA